MKIWKLKFKNHYLQRGTLGKEGFEGGMTKENNETFGGDGYVLDCGNGFIGVCLCQN